MPGSGGGAATPGLSGFPVVVVKEAAVVVVLLQEAKDLCWCLGLKRYRLIVQALIMSRPQLMLIGRKRLLIVFTLMFT